MLYDALVSHDVLAFARRAQRFYVGKRAGRTSVSQEAINACWFAPRAAAAGSFGSRRVIRSSSAEVARKHWRSRAAGIAYEVVPGVARQSRPPRWLASP